MSKQSESQERMWQRMARGVEEWELVSLSFAKIWYKSLVKYGFKMLNAPVDQLPP